MEITEDMRKLVIARLETLPSNRKISIGNTGEFSKDELIERVKKGDSVGQKMVEIEMEFLRSIKKGLFA